MATPLDELDDEAIGAGTRARARSLAFVVASIVIGTVVGFLFAEKTVGPRADVGIDDWLGPLLGDLAFRFAVVLAGVVAVIAAVGWWRGHRQEWLAFGAASFASAAVIGAILVPPDAGQGPLVATNTGTSRMLIRLETIPAGWLVEPNQQVTLLADRPADVRGAFLYDPESCEQVDLAIIRSLGPIEITIGSDRRFEDVSPLRGSAADESEPTVPGCAST